MSDDGSRGYHSTSTRMLDDARMLFCDFPYAAFGGLSVHRGSGFDSSRSEIASYSEVPTVRHRFRYLDP